MAWFCVWTHPGECSRGDWGIVTSIPGTNINRLKKKRRGILNKKIKNSEKRVVSSWNRTREMVQSGVSETGAAGSAYQVSFGGRS